MSEAVYHVPLQFACWECGTFKTSRWRKDGYDKLLCNACGVRLKQRGRRATYYTSDAPSSGTSEGVTILQGIDSVDWASLQHRHGHATDIPTWIKQLQYEYSGPRGSARAAALAKLSDCLVHRGSHWEASPHAVPFLLKLLAEVRTPVRNDIVHLLIDVAVGDPSDCQARIIDGIKSWRERAGETDWGLQSYDALRAGVPVLKTLMHQDPVPIVRSMCAFALAWFPEAARIDTQDTLASLWRLIYKRRGYPSVKATATLAIGLLTAGLICLDSDGPPYMVDLETISRLLSLHSQVAIVSKVQWAAAKVLLDFGFEDSKVIETVAKATVEIDGGWETIIPYGKDIYGCSEFTLYSFAKRKTTSSTAVDAVVDALSRSSGDVAANIAAVAIYMTFRNSPQPLPAFGKLQDEQQRVIQVIAAASETTWASAKLQGKCHQHGLPCNRTAFRKYAMLTT
ncbi:PBS lyase HEAT domain protein repeat-containing protein [Tolypocladium paradoxum]|uniref:PBS lyase HEAT domain protein repeat-containing protein n=1 Tax=Tolypocladium paradoxum TaxID=94208 RepID=A0A2S4KVB2_9HYPO|nr:PBS lyase HEAT domain protein repeat-containing protein [Tolypocladium paradoxum]